MAQNTENVKKNVKESWFNIRFNVDKTWPALINDQLKYKLNNRPWSMLVKCWVFPLF